MLRYREAVPDPETADPVLLLHGFPESSRMWSGLIEALAAEGRRAIAPDLYCLGESDDPGPATFERTWRRSAPCTPSLASAGWR